ncbi:MAG TPA: transporter substrate-binding domain-containing protein [Candidatus Limnocylindrales bacterium]|nr:transporter substrate-binding domain-containing protein [Candidatus Limnocylindrales bacterium]
MTHLNLQRGWLWLALALTLMLMPIYAITAQESTPAPGAPAGPDAPLVVGVRVIPPFVMQGAVGYYGFSIDLWEEIAARLGLEHSYVERDSVRSLLDAVRDGEVEVGIAAISITEDREETLDFSIPMFRSGLQILAPATAGLSVVDTIASLLRPSILQFVLFAVAFVVGIALLIWIAERFIARRNHQPSPGLGVTLYDTATSFLQEDSVGDRGRSRLGKVLTLVWLCIAVMFGIMLEGIVTAHLTVEQLSSQVTGLSDLYDKRVSTVNGSTSADFLLNTGITPVTFDNIEDAFALMIRGDADALVYDAPVLKYLEATRGSGRVQLVGDPFRLEYYGIALPQGSSRKEDIDRALLAIMEDGTYERLVSQWFSG